MEKESFEKDDVAEILNRAFISIKVDREERPDIDSIYMEFCQVLTGSGGWPLTIIATPDGKPFFAGTYFPRESRYGLSGLKDILNNVEDAWKNKRHDLLNSSEEIKSAVEKLASSNKYEVGIEDINKAVLQLKKSFDERHGGFSSQPKFPIPHNLLYLLRVYKYNNDSDALRMVEKTLESMYKGGIFDHVGFGFSRYSTDNRWLVPHFEKMLYDNALVSIAYIEAYQITQKELYREVAEKIFTYILRDMTYEEGGFYSAEDADSEGEEGKFYIWTLNDLKEALNNKDGELFAKYYDITESGNFEGKNIPNLISTSLQDRAYKEEMEEKFDAIRTKLFDYRDKRIHPFKDDKILTSWNGLMIAAMSIGGRVLSNQEYINAAEDALKFIYKHLMREDGRLLARYRDGEAAFLAYLEDYAFLIYGLIELYETTFKTEYLEKAVALNEDMLRLFLDNDNGGMYLYGSDSEELILRPKEIYDGAIPSGNSVAALNLIRLSRITGNEKYEETASKIFQAFGGNIKASPVSHTLVLSALLYSLAKSKEVVIAGDENDNNTLEMIRTIYKTYDPFMLVVLNNCDSEFYELVPYAKYNDKIHGKSAVYICENYACSSPVTEIKELRERLSKHS